MSVVRLRAAIHAALGSKNQDVLEGVMLLGVMAGHSPDFVEKVMRQEIPNLPHDVQHWWAEDCPCGGNP